MSVSTLLQASASRDNADAVVWRDETYSYRWLHDEVEAWRLRLAEARVESGSVVALDADFSPQAIAAFLALSLHNCICVPLATVDRERKSELGEIARCQWSVSPDGAVDVETIKRLVGSGKHELYDELRATGHPGLVLFSSGSTGETKAALHDLEKILAKFERPRRQLRTLAFLLFDHIGGVNTLFYTLSNAGCIVVAEDRRPDAVLRLIERHGVELLPVSPTFLNLVLLSGAHERHDLSSLKRVTYGTEQMPQQVLDALCRILPKVVIQQTYGLSEVGILRSKSKSSDSLWVKVGGAEFQTRVVDNVLHVKADSAMLGYLNAPTPFSEDGWLNTGDCVELDETGEYLRFLGRTNDVINVGGQKVFPAEVEAVILAAENVADVLVFGRENRIMQNVIVAEVVTIEPEERDELADRIVIWCTERLDEPYKVPADVKRVERIGHSERFKRTRRIHTELDAS